MHVKTLQFSLDFLKSGCRVFFFPVRTLRAMEILKSTIRVKDFYPYSRHINGSIFKYVTVGAVKKTVKKDLPCGGFYGFHGPYFFY
jgi:hypothetical protein